MKLVALFFILTLASGLHQAFGQPVRASVKGVVLGSDSAVLPDASVNLLFPKDSSIAAGTLTDAKGRYQFNRQDTGQFLLYISAVGHRPFFTRIHVAAPGRTDSFYLQLQPKAGDPVTVTNFSPPVVVKPDTIEHSTAAWKIRGNEAIEELIKRMPGFKLENDGSLTYNGEKLNRVLVDGKPFQLDNVATLKTLPAHIIDKIQVIDEKPKDQKYSKTDDGNREKVLNITIKPHKKKSWLRNLSVQAGNNKQRDEKLSITRLNGKRKLHLSGGEGATVQQQGGQHNRTGTLNSNFSYNDNRGEATDFSLRGNANSSDGNSSRSALRQTFLKDDTVLIGRSQYAANYGSNNAGGNFDLSWEPSKKAELSLEGGVTLNRSHNSTVSLAENFNNFKQPVNRSEATTQTRSKSDRFNAALAYNRQIDTNGRNFSARISLNTGNNENNGYNKSDNTFFNPDSTVTRRNQLNQYRQNSGTSGGLLVNSSYGMPVFRDFKLSMSYSFQYSTSRSERTTYDFDSASGKFSQFNVLQSNGFRNQSFSHRQSLSLYRKFKRINGTIRIGLQEVKHVNRNFDSAQALIQRFFNITPGANFNYYRKGGASIRLNYTGSTNQPSLQQRQPVIDNSNPLYVRSGNPDLRPEYNNQLNLSYGNTKQKAGSSFFVSADFNNTLNRITEVIQFDREGKQFSRPENVNGNYRGNISIRSSYPISRRSKSYGSVNLTAGNSRSIGFVNGVRNTGRHFTLNAGTSASLNIQEYLTLSGTAGFSHNESRYSANAVNNRSFTSFNAGFGADAHIPGDWRVQTNASYDNRGRQVDFGRETTIWNLSVSKLLLQKKLQLSIRINDILKQNIGYNRTIGDNYIEESDGAVPGRFVLVTATWSFDKFGGK